MIAFINKRCLEVQKCWVCNKGYSVSGERFCLRSHRIKGEKIEGKGKRAKVERTFIGRGLLETKSVPDPNMKKGGEVNLQTWVKTNLFVAFASIASLFAPFICAGTAQAVPFKVMITELVQLDDGIDPDSSIGDFYAEVTIDGVVESNKPACGDSGLFGGILVPFTLFKNFDAIPDCPKMTPWIFTKDLSNSDPINVSIKILDDDEFSGDDVADANPGPSDTIDLVVDPATGKWSGDFDWPQNCSRVPPFELGGDRVRVCWQISFDTDGDGLLDVWEMFGIDMDGDGTIDVDLPAFGADPMHKDVFLELDWMNGAEPTLLSMQIVKSAFAAAPKEAGGIVNPDDQPGINLWVDTGGLEEGGILVGDNLGGGNAVPVSNISDLNEAYFEVKNNNFDPNRIYAFRYGLRSLQPSNNEGMSTGGNSSTTLNDTTQDWINGEWAERTLNITGGLGADQKRTIIGNSATQLQIDKAWDTIPDATSEYQIQLVGGLGERGGNDLILYSSLGKTFLHEFGHSLNLGHGGGDGLQSLDPDAPEHNCKPNYLSVMNYDHPLGVAMFGGGHTVDFSPPRFPDGGRGNAPLPIPNAVIDETNLDESIVLDPDDEVHAFVWTNADGVKVRDTPANKPVDWNQDGDTDDSGLEINIDLSNSDGFPPDCDPSSSNGMKFNQPLSEIEGHDDWSNISIPFVQFGDSKNDALNLIDLVEPTDEELIQYERELNTNDLFISKKVADPGAVEVGSDLVYDIKVTNKGPNAALSVQVVDILPAKVSYLSDDANCEEAPVGTITCDIGGLSNGQEQQINITVSTDNVCEGGIPTSITNTATVANVVQFSAPDTNPGDNTDSTTITPVDTTAPNIYCNAPDTIRPRDAPISFTATATDLCDSDLMTEITGFDCSFINPGGKRVDKKESCVIALGGDTIQILDSGGVGNHITWSARASDDSGNIAEAECEVEVVVK